jgi:hypothetical protein
MVNINLDAKSAVVPHYAEVVGVIHQEIKNMMGIVYRVL